MSTGSSRAAAAARLAALQAFWRGQTARQRMLARAALTVLAGAALWWVVLGPALTTLRTASAQRQALDMQMQRMRLLEAQVVAMRSTLQSMPPLDRDEALRALEVTARQQFGAAGRLTAGSEGATLALSGVSGDALAQWLAQARIEARTLPGEARLQRRADGLWDGRLVLRLPAPVATR